MADDNMEIYSEHGQPAGDDIDIDIDFTAGQANEDDILQDVQLSTHYGNEYPLMHEDDPMADDDNASYQMEDIDLTQDEVEQDADPEPMSFATSDIHFGSGEDPNEGDAITDSRRNNTEFEEEQDNYECEVTEGDFVLVPENETQGNIEPGDAKFPGEDEDVSSIKLTDDIQEVEHNSLQHQADESTSLDRSFNPAQDELRSPPSPASRSTSVPARTPIPCSHEADGHPLDLGQNSHEESVKAVEPDSSDGTHDISKAPDVKVIYQSVEYALFSTSDLDDPDSFFLSDLGIMEKPLDQFFSAIREIIRDDLTTEDELCLNIEELGLETEEASSTLSDVTLAQVLSLHQKLLQNDLVDSPGPVYILLSTRINFSKRFANLQVGASHGKGLSELVIQHENNDNLGDTEVVDDASDDIESNLEHHGASENVEAGFKSETKDIEGSQIRDTLSETHHVDAEGIYSEEHLESDEGFQEDQEGPNAEIEADFQVEPEDQYITQEGETIRPSYGVEGGIQSEGQTATTTDFTLEPDFANDDNKSINALQQSPKGTEPTKSSIKGTSKTVSGENDEEEDLIDYSDEEIEFPEDILGRTAVTAGANRTDTGTDSTFISPCIRPDSCFCYQCSLLIRAEYEAKDEELRRRSISRQAEEKLLEQSEDQTSTNDNDEDPNQQDNGYAEYYTKKSHTDQSDSYDLTEHTGEPNLADQDHQQVGLSNDLEPFNEDEATYIFDNEVEVGDRHNDMDDFAGSQKLDGEEVELQGIPPYTEETTQTESFDFESVRAIQVTHERPVPSSASSLGAAETTESSVTLGAEEISYDDYDVDFEQASNIEQKGNASADPSNAPLLEQNDEIDYEDDEDEELAGSPSSGAVTATKVLPNSNGKRSIAEVESVFLTSTKDAKRPRS